MKWLDQWLYKKTRDMWDNKHLYEQQVKEREYIKMGTMNAVQIDRGRAEGEAQLEEMVYTEANQLLARIMEK